jgi:hypothetical protein
MIDKLFFSDKNKYAIKTIINNELLIKDNYDKIMDDTMNYVLSQVSTIPPKGMDEEEYLFLMNKKVYDLLKPILKNLVKQEIKPELKQEVNNRKNKILNNDPTNLFDPILMKQFENPPIIDYPVPSSFNKISEDNNSIKKIEEKRSTLIPKIKPIDFTSKDNNENKQDTTLLYNDLLTKYNSFLQNDDSLNTPQNNLINTPQNNLINTPQNNLINTPQNNVINTPQNNVINTPQNNLINTPQNNLMNTHQNNLMNTSVNNIMNTPQNNLMNTSVNNIMNTPQNNLINTPQNNLMNTSVNNIMNTPQNNLMNRQINKQNNYLIINSKNRNLEKFPNPSSFEFNFEKIDNKFEYKEFYDENNILIIKNKIIRYDSNKYENIKIISLKNVIIPITDSINKEPYLFLEIPQIKGPHISDYNILSKLNIDYQNNKYFLKLIPDEDFEINNILENKIRLNLINQNSIYHNVGIDKLYIESFEINDNIINTKFTILNNNHSIKEGDLLYFYDTFPKNEDICFLEDNIRISKFKFKNGNFLEIFCVYQFSDKLVNINFKYLISDLKDINHYYIIIYNLKINKYYYFKIDSFTDDSIIVVKSEEMNKDINQFKEYNSLKIGICRKNLGGYSIDDTNSLFSSKGHSVLNVNNYSFEVDFSYNLFKEYFNNRGIYVSSDIFFIQSKLQINYTFIVKKND